MSWPLEAAAEAGAAAPGVEVEARALAAQGLALVGPPAGARGWGPEDPPGFLPQA